MACPHCEQRRLGAKEEQGRGTRCLGCGVGRAPAARLPGTRGRLRERRVGWIPEGHLERSGPLVRRGVQESAGLVSGLVGRRERCRGFPSVLLAVVSTGVRYRALRVSSLGLLAFIRVSAPIRDLVSRGTDRTDTSPCPCLPRAALLGATRSARLLDAVHRVSLRLGVQPAPSLVSRLGVRSWRLRERTGRCASRTLAA